MKISIIIATYNSGKTLNRCLDSIVYQLTDDCELIIIDGGSKDNTNKIIASYGSKVAYTVSERDYGVYDAWNKGIKASKGDWITFIGSDDELLPKTIDKYMNYISSCPHDTELITGKLHFIGKNGHLIRNVGEPFDWYKLVHRKLSLAHPGMLHNRKCFEKYGLFDTRYKICADSDFLQRLGKDAKSVFVDDFFVNMSEGGISDSLDALRESFVIRYRNNNLSIIENIIGSLQIIILLVVKRIIHKG